MKIQALLLSLLLVTPAVAQSTSQKAVTGPATYVDGTYGFSLKLAPNWGIIPGARNWEHTSGMSSGKRGIRSIINLNVAPNNANGRLKRAMHRAFDEGQRLITRSFPNSGSHIVNEGPVASGRPAYLIETVGTASGKPVASVMTWAEMSPTQLLRMSATCEGEDWKSVVPEAKALMQSLRFK